MTGEGLFISTLNYHRNDKEEISKTIPLGCMAHLKLCRRSCALSGRKISLLFYFARDKNTMCRRARPESYHFPSDFYLLQSAERCYG